MLKTGYLPGNIRERITERREQCGLTREDCARRVGISPATQGRIEDGMIDSVKSDLIIRYAETLNCSADYLLGLADHPEKKDFALKQLGLSYDAGRVLVLGRVDTDAVNHLICSPYFPQLTNLISQYLGGSVTEGVKARNRILTMAAGDLTAAQAENPGKRTEIQKGINEITASRILPGEINFQRIESLFHSMLTEMQKEMKKPEKKQFGLLTEEMLQEMNAEAMENYRRAKENGEKLTMKVILQPTMHMMGKVMPVTAGQKHLFGKLFHSFVRSTSGPEETEIDRSGS